jgi:hypothetical protein
MENNDLKNTNGVNATPDGKYTDKPSHDSIQKNSLGEEITNSLDSTGEILPLSRIEREKKDSQTGRLKKKDVEDMELLPNRSWVTNFYHNYIKAVESADLTPKPAAKHSHNPEPEEANAMKTKQASSLSGLPLADDFKSRIASPPFQSLLFLKAKKQESAAFHGLKVDTQMWRAYKNSIAKEKDGVIQNSHPVKNLAVPYNTPTSQEQKPQFRLSDIPLKQFEKFGISQEDLLKPGMLENLLKGEKTLPVNHLYIKNSKGEALPFRASFFLEKKPDGTTAVKMNYLPQQPLSKVYDQIQGYKVSPEMKKQLEEKGSVSLFREPVWGRVESVLKIDRLLNKLLVMSNQEKKIPEEIMGVKLSEKQQLLLKQGNEVTLSGLKTKDDRQFHGSIKWDQQKNRLMFISASADSLNKTRKKLKEDNNLAKTAVKAVNLTTEREHGRKEHLVQQPKGIRR